MCNKQNCNFIEILETGEGTKLFVHYEIVFDKDMKSIFRPIYLQYESWENELIDFELIKSGRKCW